MVPSETIMVLYMYMELGLVMQGCIDEVEY